jgi:predicted PurR-regulated permease PerM
MQHVVYGNLMAQTSLFVFVGLFAIITVGLLGALVFALTKLQKQIDKLTGKLDPLIGKATDAVETVQRVTMSVGEKADTILTRGEALTENVSEKVEKTAGVVQTTVTTPLINLSSLLAGVSRGFSVYSRAAGRSRPANGAQTYSTESTIAEEQIVNGRQ